MASGINSAFLNSDLTGAVKNAVPKLNIAGAATKVGMATSKVGDAVTQGLMSTPTGVTQIIGGALTAGKMASDAIHAGNTDANGFIKDKDKFGLANAFNPFSYLNGINNTDKFNKHNGEIRGNKLLERLNSQQPIAKEAEQFSSYVKKGGKIKDPNRPKYMKSMYGGVALYKNGEFLKTNQKMNANTSGVTPKLMFFKNGGVPKFQTPAGPINRTQKTSAYTTNLPDYLHPAQTRAVPVADSLLRAHNYNILQANIASRSQAMRPRWQGLGLSGPAQYQPGYAEHAMFWNPVTRALNQQNMAPDLSNNKISIVAQLPVRGPNISMAQSQFPIKLGEVQGDSTINAGVRRGQTQDNIKVINNKDEAYRKGMDDIYKINYNEWPILPQVIKNRWRNNRIGPEFPGMQPDSVRFHNTRGYVKIGQ